MYALFNSTFLHCQTAILRLLCSYVLDLSRQTSIVYDFIELVCLQVVHEPLSNHYRSLRSLSSSQPISRLVRQVDRCVQVWL